MARVLFLESFFGGSHKAFAEVLAKRSRHEIELVTLASRFPSWRLAGAHVKLARMLAKGRQEADLLFVTGLCDVAALRGMLPERFRATPLLLYMHENQLTYPVQIEGREDHRFALLSVTSCLAADSVVFNSKFQRDEFLNGARPFLSRFPDYRFTGVSKAIGKRAQVAYPPVVDPSPGGPAPRDATQAPLVVFNHRWEYDKQPEVFVQACEELAAAGVDFRLALLGERFAREHPSLGRAREQLGERIVADGFLPAGRYRALLSEASLVVSTAIQENFGIAIVEAMMAGCVPLLPNRLSYPELLGTPNARRAYLHEPDELVAKLTATLSRKIPEAERAAVRETALRFEAGKMVAALDGAIDHAIAAGRTADTVPF